MTAGPLELVGLPSQHVLYVASPYGRPRIHRDRLAKEGDRLRVPALRDAQQPQPLGPGRVPWHSVDVGPEGDLRFVVTLLSREHRPEVEVGVAQIGPERQGLAGIGLGLSGARGHRARALLRRGADDRLTEVQVANRAVTVDLDRPSP